MVKIVRLTESKLVKLINNIIKESKELSDKEVYNALKSSIDKGEVTFNKVLGEISVSVEPLFFFDNREKRSLIISFLKRNGFKRESESTFVRYSKNTDKELRLSENNLTRIVKRVIEERKNNYNY